MITREFGTISDTFLGKEDHGIQTAWIYLDFKGSSQGFGGLSLTNGLDIHFISDLCSLFNVDKFKDLKGKKCYALRCFDTWNTPIEGLETENGEIFTITDFRHKHVPGKIVTPLENKKTDLLSTISWATGRIKQAEQDLKEIEKEYVAWSNYENKLKNKRK